MEIASSVLSYLANVAVRSLGLAALALVAVLLLRIKAAAALHAVCTLVVAGMLALAAFAPMLPPMPIRVLRTEVQASLDLPGLTLEAPAVPGSPLTQSRVVSPLHQTSWQPALAIAYGAGALVFLIRLAFSYLFTRRLVRASRAIDRSWATEVYESTWISVPATVGWLRPRILLPPDWAEWEAAKLDAVLAHERTHVRRGDWAVSVLAGLNRSIFWFHPLAWWLERRLASLAEEACDDAALLLVDTEPYAQALLDMAAAVKTGQGRLIWEAMAMAKVAEVRQRIERILDETRQIPRGLTRSRWAVAIACSLPIVYMASVVQLAPAQEKQTGTPAAINELLKTGRQLSAADVSQMEQYLAANPHDLEVRKQLVVYYFGQGIREPRLSHIFWLIANHPEANQALFASKGITPRTTAFNDASDFARAAGLWKQQAAAQATNGRVMVNAAEFLAQSGGDFDEAEQLLIAAHKLQPSFPLAWGTLGRLYTRVIVASAGDPQFPSLNSTFAERAKLQLENSTDGALLSLTGSLLAGVGQRPQPGKKLPQGVINLDEHPMLIPVVEMGNRLITRAEQFGHVQRDIPGTFLTGPNALEIGIPVTSPSAPPPPPSAPPLATAPVLIRSVGPQYPPLARQAGISGDVELMATIATDGTVREIRTVPGHGHPLLIGAAIAAVKQWVYAPIPSPGTIDVSVPFRLEDARPVGGVVGGVPGGVPGGVIGGVPGGVIDGVPGGVPSAAPAIPKKVRIGGAVQAASLTRKVDPIYPADARAAGLEGDVMLSVTIGEDGHVESAIPTDGNPALATAAADAVKQWVYKPTMLNGQPVSVETTVAVPFRLQ